MIPGIDSQCQPVGDQYPVAKACIPGKFVLTGEAGAADSADEVEIRGECPFARDKGFTWKDVEAKGKIVVIEVTVTVFQNLESAETLGACFVRFGVPIRGLDM